MRGLTIGLRQTFVPPLNGRDLAAQPEHYTAKTGVAIRLSFDHLEELSRAPTASWAIWNDNGPNDIAFFSAKLESLHGRVVILGLNRGNRAHGQEAIPFEVVKRKPDGNVKDAGYGPLRWIMLADIEDQFPEWPRKTA